MEEEKGSPVFRSATERLKYEFAKELRARLKDIDKALSALEPQLKSLLEEKSLASAALQALGEK